jgi:phosphoribosylformylglycinamidine synthase
MKFAVIRFPGSNCDCDCVDALTGPLGRRAELVWHKQEDLLGYDAVIVPGGFSYGDYLRAGAIARFSPIMKAVTRFAREGGLVLGICNGFQILCEAGLLPGALIRNKSLHFVCRHVKLEVRSVSSPFTHLADPRQTLNVPVAHGEGCYFAEESVIHQLEENDQILFRYAAGDNPNGSLGNIAGICNLTRNVCGMMPHPERACESRLGSVDGRVIFESMLQPQAQEFAPASPSR